MPISIKLRPPTAKGKKHKMVFFEKGSLSRHVLWNRRTLDAGVRNYARRFGFRVRPT